MNHRLLPEWLTLRSDYGFAASIIVASITLLSPTLGEALEISVRAYPEPTIPVTGYRYLLEEDTTVAPTPGAQSSESIAFKIHSSYAPVADTGEAGGAAFMVTADVPADRRYVLTILPPIDVATNEPEYAIGGANIEVGQTEVTVILQPMPLPTAQISIFTFIDNDAIDNEVGGEEVGLGGVTVILNDFAGQVQVDAFGNPLGTTYSDTSGTIATLGTGNLLTDDSDCPTGPNCGHLLIKNMPRGKYGVVFVPPVGEGWQQTTTIEGTPTIDTWVKANEPPIFAEFGAAGPHIFAGFVQAFNDLATVTDPGDNVETITGNIVTLHNSRPPTFSFSEGIELDALATSCWIGINAAGIGGTGLYAGPCDTESSFSIAGVPEGDYQLVVWDQFLGLIIGFDTFTVNSTAAGGGCVPDCDFGNVSEFTWFGRQEHFVFFDEDEDGFPDPSETSLIPEQNVNLRNRDGSIYQAFPTDLTGFVPFDEIFPFFFWQVMEVDFARFKATGVTYVVDGGGDIPADTGWAGVPSFDIANPQEQCDPNTDPLDADYGDCDDIVNPHTGNNLSTTMDGEVLTLAYQTFQGLNNVIYWGKKNYDPGENGGIAGVISYGTTRAEDDPRFAAAEEWEPGIPRVQIALYQDSDGDGEIDSLDGVDSDNEVDLEGNTNVWDLADVDNYPFGFMDCVPSAAPCAGPGDEDIDRNGNGFFNYADAIMVGTTDSWDDNPPVDCPREGPDDGSLLGELEGKQNPFYANGDPATPGQDCMEGLASYGQIRPAVFDGGYAFTSHFEDGGQIASGDAAGAVEVDGIPSGTYIVETVPPPGYEIIKEEDKNVDFGDIWEPDPLLLPPICVGDEHEIPEFLTLFPTINSPFWVSGETTLRPLCDRKQIVLNDGQNPDVSFGMFTFVPKAARIVGRINDDFAVEFDPTSPNNAEKFGPAWVPVSVQDYEGNEIIRTNSDEYGFFNLMLPSTYTVNAPTPSGVTPEMWRVCLNSPSRVPNPLFGQPNQPATVVDPFFNPTYGKTCYTFDYWPGKTTYLDTPVIRIAAFGGQVNFPLDCQAPTDVPAILWVSGSSDGTTFDNGPIALPGQSVEIRSRGGAVEVPNPEYLQGGTEPLTIQRNYGFGALEGAVTVDGASVNVTSWDDDRIVFDAPASGGQVIVTLPDGSTSNAAGTSVTMTIGDPAGATRVSPGESIQAAIDAAAVGDLIIVEPGLYSELLIVYKDIRLQGWGAASVLLDGAAENPQLEAWSDNLLALITGNPAFLLPGQLTDPAGAFGTGFEGIVTESYAILVLDDDTFPAVPPRIDGFTVTGSLQGAGIFVNGNTDELQISNNVITANGGRQGGGIQVGHLDLDDNADNDNLRIVHNRVHENGAIFDGVIGQGPGGGISLYRGSTDYLVEDNFICGNFSSGGGGGIAHVGLSNGGMIVGNRIVFNESFNQGFNVSGGGVLLTGSGLNTGGAGDPVTVSHNVIQGNLAGAGDGGGIAAIRFNGSDVVNNPGNPSAWDRLRIWNNVIVNNLAAVAGGGVSLQDAVSASVVNNTIAHNDSTGTGQDAFLAGNLNESIKNPAGFVARAHGNTNLGTAGGGFSNPTAFDNNIIYENRAFNVEITGTEILIVPDTTAPGYVLNDHVWDIGVLPIGAGTLAPGTSTLTLSTYPMVEPGGPDYTGSGNIFVDPEFVTTYFIAARESIGTDPNAGGIGAAGAFDEGGNFINVNFGPLSLFDPATGDMFGDYHIVDTSPAIDVGNDAAVPTPLIVDIDGEDRTVDIAGVGTAVVDMGADEYVESEEGPPLGPLSSGIGDGVPDRLDNCMLVSNSDQANADGDFYGNQCDADYDNNGSVDFIDFGIFRTTMLFTTNPEGDFNGDGTVDFIDFGILRTKMLFNPPGPSGLEP